MPLDQDSDDAPEDVSFSTGRADALRGMELMTSERKKQGNPEKAWRQRRDAQYKKQKEQKQLSLDILTKVDADLKKKHASAGKSADREETEKDEDGEISDYDSDQGEGEQDNNSDKESGIGEEDGEDNDQALAEEEIARQEVTVCVVRKKEPQPLLQSALDFKAQALYGKDVRRMNMAQVKRRGAKRKAMDQLKRGSKNEKRVAH